MFCIIKHMENENETKMTGTIEIPLTPAGIPDLVFDGDMIREEEAGDKMATALSAMAELRFN